MACSSAERPASVPPEDDAREPAEQIATAQKELAHLLPWIDLSQARWATLRVDRAEPQQSGLIRPDNAFLAEQERRRSVDLPHELYDVTAWSVGPMAGVDVALCNAAVSGEAMRADAPIAAKAEGSGNFGIAVPWTDSGQARLVALALREGIDGRVTDRAFTTAGREFPRGTVVFPAGSNGPDKMARLTAALGDQFKESARLEAAIRQNLAGLGYEV